MKITRVDPLVGVMVEVELVALRQMVKALQGLVDSDYGADAMRSILRQLVEGPLLQNAQAIEEGGDV